MASRTYSYSIAGTVTIDDIDLRTAFLGMPVQLETINPTDEQLLEESADWANLAQTAPPEMLLRIILSNVFEPFRVNVRPGRHPYPVINVDPVEEPSAG